MGLTVGRDLRYVVAGCVAMAGAGVAESALLPAWHVSGWVGFVIVAVTGLTDFNGAIRGRRPSVLGRAFAITVAMAVGIKLAQYDWYLVFLGLLVLVVRPLLLPWMAAASRPEVSE